MLIIFVERAAPDGRTRLNILYIGRWRTLFSNKMASAASFSFKIVCGSQYLVILLAAVLTWSGYWDVAIMSGEMMPELQVN